MEIRGEKVALVPIKLEERDGFYKLATKSYGSKFWYDAKRKKECTKTKFFKDWHKGYFNLKLPKEGQCFWILVNGEKIGQVNYNKIDQSNKKVEIDIIIGNRKNMGKGYGSNALRTLIKYLFKNFDINKIWIEARANNLRAIKAYQKTGFRKEGILREEEYFEGKFVDCVRLRILRKEFHKKFVK